MELIINGTIYKCIEYAKSVDPLKNGWHTFIPDMDLDEEATYLVSWISNEGKYSNPIRAFWENDDQAFFPIDCHFTFPLKVDRFMEIHSVGS